MDSLTHFHSRNVHFYIHFSNNLKVTALDMFQKNFGFTPPLSKNIAIFGPFGGHFDFFAAILDFYWFVRY